MYDSLRDAEFRLNRTVVWFRGKHWYVSNVRRGEDRKFVLILLNGGDELLVSLDDPELSVRSIPTGYVNVRGRACYLKRIPTRTYRQGLRGDNSDVSRVGFGSFVDSLLGDEVPLDEDKILSRDYAVIRDRLYYRGKHVGVWVDNKPYLSNDTEFLKESLEELQLENNND